MFCSTLNMNTARGLMAAGAMLLGCATAQAQSQSLANSSALRDPQLAGMFQKARELLPQVQSGELLQWPVDTSFRWPCAVPEVDVRRMIGGLALRKDDFNEQERRAQDAHPMAAAARDSVVIISDVRYQPIAGTCEDGKLHGPVDFMLEFTRLDQLKSSDKPVIITYRVRTKVVMERGERALNQTRAMIQKQLHFKSEGPDGKPLNSPLTTNLMLDARRSETEYFSVLFAGATGQAGIVLFTVPVAPDTVETLVYNNSRLTMRSQMKNNRPHGASLVYDDTGKVISKECFVDGVAASAQSCPG